MGGVPVVTIEIPLTRGYVTRIDDADMTVAAGHSWSAAVNPDRRAVYAVSKIGGRVVALHNLLCPGWTEVDHADGDGLNNQRVNLRNGAGFGRNQANRVMQRTNTSGWKGVCWHKRRGKWVAHIRVGGKQVYLGGYDAPEEAADAYDRAAISHFGDYARTNAMLRREPVTVPWQHNPPDDRTHCGNGHERTPENTWISPDGSKRECRKCGRLRKAESRERARKQAA